MPERVQHEVGRPARASGAVVVAGMHRSGTSLVAGLLAALGVDLGRRLIPADRRNPRGYFEDAEIVEFHGRLFRALLPAAARGHVDWGWSEEAELDREGLAAFAREARELAGERARTGRPWGFKDPRASLLLDFWVGCIDQARFVLVYRQPWQVADSMQRIGRRVFLEHPSYAYRIWEHYNRCLADFYERHSARCLLLDAGRLPQELERLRLLLTVKLGLELGPAELGASYDPELFHSEGGDDPRADLVATAYPECTRLLERLDGLADISGGGTWRRRPPPRTLLGRPDPGRPVAISIVIPVHDDGVLLLDALASVERCGSRDCELILVDDGSRDPETLRILAALRGRGHFVVERENGGLSAARNTAIACARGRYVLPLDADNRLRPGFVEAAMAALASDPGLGVVYGDRQLFGALQERVAVPEFELCKMLAGNYIDACALYRRELWEQAGGYDTAMTGLEDWEFWLGAGRRGWRFRHLDLVAFDYRVRPDSLLATSLVGRARRRLMGHVLHKHVDAFHERLPAPLRALSSAACLLVPQRWQAGVRQAAAGLFWHPLWALVGPGGLLASDRRTRRALRESAES